jgi:hypothetical protein
MLGGTQRGSTAGVINKNNIPTASSFKNNLTTTTTSSRFPEKSSSGLGLLKQRSHKNQHTAWLAASNPNATMYHNKSQHAAYGHLAPKTNQQSIITSSFFGKGGPANDHPSTGIRRQQSMQNDQEKTEASSTQVRQTQSSLD